MQKEMSSLDQFRKSFLEKHGMHFCQSLQSCFCGPIYLKPTPLNSEVQERFFNSCNGDLDGSLLPAFHGTATSRLMSIYEKGFLIPGVENHLKVVHGSAHGLGIYTATIDSPLLSWGFCSSSGGESMLVCGVLSDAVNNPAIQHMGNLEVKSESADVLHVGNAIVIFDTKRVAPLFVATRYVPPASNYASWQIPPRRTRSKYSSPLSKLKHQKVPKGIIAFLCRRGAQKRRDST